MTPEEFAEKMKALAERNTKFPYCDVEDNHILMDALMCECLRSLGFSEGVNIYESTEKWYS